MDVMFGTMENTSELLFHKPFWTRAIEPLAGAVVCRRGAGPLSDPPRVMLVLWELAAAAVGGN